MFFWTDILWAKKVKYLFTYFHSDDMQPGDVMELELH